MKKVAIILALMLVIGIVFISGCTTNQSNTQNSSGNSQNGSNPNIPGYSIGQKVDFETGNNGFNIESDGPGKI